MNRKPFVRPIQIFGCGNTLFGDDGFGPAVIDHLISHYPLPDTVLAVDAGTGICNFLFDIILSPSGILEIFIIDAVVMNGRQPGDLFQLGVEKIPHKKAGDFSLHQFPSVRLLEEINHETSIKITVLAVQAAHIPKVVQPGLSPEVRNAVKPACDFLFDRIVKNSDAIMETHKSGRYRCLRSQ